MKKMLSPLQLLAAAVCLLTLCACEGVNPQVQAWNDRLPAFEGLPRVTAAQLLKEVNLHQDLLPKGRVGRMGWPMRPQYITIHCTENYAAGADAYQHARALHNGALRAHKCPGGNRTGYLTWHFTVQDSAVVQHLPINEQGEHADFDGPGNRTSIGIEMCENAGNDQAWTVDRAARLAAYIMATQGIPLSNVVPHYHWARVGVTPEHKPCPHFLMNNGRPGATWRWFLSRVQLHYSRIVPG